MDMSAAPKPVGAYTDERRGDERITSIYRPVLIEVGGVMRFCLLRNISTAGFMGMAYAEIPEGAAIRIEFSEQNWAQGIVKWCENHRIGVEFSHEIDVLSVLQELGKRVVGGKINRAPRLAIEHPLELEIAKRRMASKMFDISQKGVKIPAGTLSVGDEALVHIDGMQSRMAIVRWKSGDRAGLNFVRPLPFDELAEWSIRQGPECQAELVDCSRDMRIAS